MVEVIPENGGPIRQHTNEPIFRDVWLHMSLGEAGQAQAHRTSRRSAWRSYASPSTRTVLAGRRRYPSSIRDTEWCRTRERPRAVLASRWIFRSCLQQHQGFTNTGIATVTKVFGFWIALGGTFMAGWLIPRIGMMSSLIIGTVAGSASHLALAFLAAHGGDGGNAFWTFALAVGVEGFAYAFASIVLITYMSTLASVEHAASQFGLLTSLCAFPGSILAGFSGFVIEQTGFVWFFIWTSFIGIPVALLAVFVWYRIGISDEAPIRVDAGH
jgi:hypothetical protein